ncbi:MAG TPA: glycosyl hydrolase [Acidobacteriaceae bacterium]
MVWKRWAQRAGVVVAVCVAAGAAPAQQSALARLRQEFVTPPGDARPMVRWWWFGAAVTKPEILRELQQMKSDGIGGAELAFVYPQVLDDPARGLKNLPFLSPEMLADVTYAQAESHKLGLRIDVTLCSGWPYGGPAITLAEASTHLRTAEVAVPAQATSVRAPKLDEGERFISGAIVNLLANPSAGPVPERGRGRAAAPRRITWDPATARPFSVTAGEVRIAPAAAARVAVFFVLSHTKQQVKRAAVGAEGWVLDPFSHDAVATHLKAVGEPLVKAFGATPPYAIFSDSLEAYGADWTPNLPAEFLKRRGYDLIPHLAELVGGGSPAADRVRHDYGVTLTELVNENYLTQINDWAISHHTKFRSQTYGEPAVSFSSQNLVGLAEGEGPQWRAFSTLRWATSANHVFGHNITSGETFTWLHSPVFRATPLDMKAEADIDFIMGENQLIFHGWPYSPPDHEVPEPGWSLYAATSMNDHNPWHPVMPDVTRYITRVSALLRQGEPANQVAILLPTDDAWASFSPSHTTVTGALAKLVTPELMSAILSAGYNVDYIDAEAIDKVGLGTHQILVIPPTDRIPLASVEKLRAWVQSGGKIICVGRAPSLTPEGKTLASAPFASIIPGVVTVPNEDGLETALHSAARPDLPLDPADIGAFAPTSVGYIRRKLPNADIYFVANTANKMVMFGPEFATMHKHGVQLNPDTGEITAFNRQRNITLAPYESTVFLFSDDAVEAPSGELGAVKGNITLDTDWEVKFTGSGITKSFPRFVDWTADSSTLHYSGEAVYSRDFNLERVTKSVYLEVGGGGALPGAPNSPPEHEALGANGLPNPLITRPGPGMHAYFDPPIHEAALVSINGQAAGALWHPPYALDITKLVTSGENHIEIRVYNTALNAWSALPPHDYKPLIEKYGDRFQMQDLDKVKPISSGILGSIHLVERE